MAVSYFVTVSLRWQCSSVTCKNIRAQICTFSTSMQTRHMTQPHCANVLKTKSQTTAPTHCSFHKMFKCSPAGPNTAATLGRIIPQIIHYKRCKIRTTWIHSIKPNEKERERSAIIFMSCINRIFMQLCAFFLTGLFLYMLFSQIYSTALNIQLHIKCRCDLCLKMC